MQIIGEDFNKAHNIAKSGDFKDWQEWLAENDSEPDEALVEGIINATESFLRSSEFNIQ